KKIEYNVNNESNENNFLCSNSSDNFLECSDCISSAMELSEISTQTDDDVSMNNNASDAYESPRKIQKNIQTSLSSLENQMHGWTVSNEKLEDKDIDSSHRSRMPEKSKNESKKIHSEKLAYLETASKSDSNKKELRYDFLVNIKDKFGRRIDDKDYDSSTLLITEKQLEKLTPFEQQFWRIKKDYWDTIVFFKKGKFYELYENDADVASKLFNFRITDRVNMRMAGFPESTLDDWICKFLDAGYKIARVDQAENMIAKKIREKGSNKDKIIKRELKEIITQGTIYDLNHIKNNNSVYTIVVRENLFCSTDDKCGMAVHFSIILFDACTLKIFYKTFCDDKFYNKLRNLFIKYNIKECISKKKYNFIINYVKVDESKNTSKFEIFSDEENECYGYLYNYLKYLKREIILSKCSINKLENIELRMILDSSTIINMDLINDDHNKTLFDSINFCSTPFGQRRLKNWMLSPLTSIKCISERQRLSKGFDSINIQSLITDFKSLGDLERLFSKLRSGNYKFRDLKMYLDKLESILKIYKNIENLYLEKFCKDDIIFDPSNESIQWISHFEEILDINPKMIPKLSLLRELHLFIENYELKYHIIKDEIVPGKNNSEELTSLIDQKDILLKKFDDYLVSQKVICKNDSIVYKNIGKEIFQMDIPKNVKVPDDYFLVSATKTTNRYYTMKLKELISEYVELEERIFQSQGTLLNRAVDSLLESESLMFRIINDLSNIDCLISFSLFNRQIQGCVPEVSSQVEIKDLGNPIYKDYVTNDYIEDKKILILTGSNMAGKSTFMRSFCLNIILFQMGLNVMATKFKCPLFDKLFSRIGASDNLVRGESTFMIELLETSNILKNATSKSFVIMDELGRGTSTRDGECIAFSVLNKLKTIGCRVLFSTHYHNLISDNLDYSLGYMDTRIQERDVIFLYKLVKGVCTDSNGIYVAKLAGVPDNVISLASSYKEEIRSSKKV
ncbi:hypothetical protein P3W45_001828, partial [Vairimorpha bombi]